ncbi:MAG: 16S rRNA (cytosine(1402)-N(4))-methyltransferase, partial [Coriobacteriales bacterium]|nr:16S rRNA (cytosine(1402)-N(4))-methyltransferase [Coriobacteriales bacterium]
MTEYGHIPVMVAECREHLALAAGEVFCDCTFGLAGHSLALAGALLPGGALVAIDQDQDVLGEGTRRLTKAYSDLAKRSVHANFGQLDQVLAGLSLVTVDAFLF